MTVHRNSLGSPRGRLFETRTMRHIGGVRITWLGPVVLIWKIR